MRLTTPALASLLCFTVPFANLTGTVRWIIRPFNRIGRPQALHDETAAPDSTGESGRAAR